jgi:hypothetical protein
VFKPRHTNSLQNWAAMRRRRIWGGIDGVQG